ncbi:MAG: nucleoside deaminase [Muribaculaceae bacterium]|nr:nucleoside deaminase [Muribaculaceae bacterium]
MFINSDERFMRLALDEAQLASSEDEVPVGAVITVNGKVIAKAHNLTERLCDVTAHAEMQAITAASDYLGGKYLKDCTLYVTVEPCAMCAAALGWAQIGRVVWGADDSKRGFRCLYATPRGPFHPKTILESGLFADEARMQIQSFFRNKR